MEKKQSHAIAISISVAILAAIITTAIILNNKRKKALLATPAVTPGVTAAALQASTTTVAPTTTVAANPPYQSAIVTAAQPPLASNYSNPAVTPLPESYVTGGTIGNYYVVGSVISLPNGNFIVPAGGTLTNPIIIPSSLLNAVSTTNTTPIVTPPAQATQNATANVGAGKVTATVVPLNLNGVGATVVVKVQPLTTGNSASATARG